MYEPKVGDRVQRVHGLKNHCVPDLVMGTVKRINSRDFNVLWDGVDHTGHTYNFESFGTGEVVLIGSSVDEWEGELELEE